MACSCARCSNGIKGGPATPVALCDVGSVACGGTIPGLGPVIGSLDAAPLAVSSPSAQDITDFSAFTWKGFLTANPAVDAFTTYPTGAANILDDNDVAWDIGVANNTEEAIFKLTINNPFAVCDAAEITLMSILLDYTAVVTAGTGVLFPGIWVAWRKADNSLIQLVDLAGTSEYGVNVRVYVPAVDTITVDDIANGYALVGCNLTLEAAGTNTSQIQFDYMAARFDYDATVCSQLAGSDPTFALPVQICNPTLENEEAWAMSSGELTIGATTTSDLNGVPINTRVISIYNPGPDTLIVRFADLDGSTNSQRIPPTSSYSFGVPNDRPPIDHTSVTVENPGAASVDIVWNASSVAV